MAATTSGSTGSPLLEELVSANGIVVEAWRWITARTVEVDIATDAVDPSAVHGPHRVRITLPADYGDRPETGFPVLYLLHGGAGGGSAQWTSDGDVEAITTGHDLVTVMPDGGKVGWYTNWVDQSAGAQRWADYHLDQLPGWVEANVRTNPTRGGRAIAGLSMGGFGAVRYAQDRPDRFAFVASFSGALDLGDPGVRFVIAQQSTENAMPPHGAFGPPDSGDSRWHELDPLARVERLRGMGVALYAGSGVDDGDIIERTVAAATTRMHEHLDAGGVDHHCWLYGRPGPSSPYGCNGGHDFACWNLALLDALPRMLAVLETTP